MMRAPPPLLGNVPLPDDKQKDVFSLCNPESDRCYPCQDVVPLGPLQQAVARFYHHASDPHALCYTVSRGALVNEMQALGHFFLTRYPAPMLVRHAAAMDIELGHLRSLRPDTGRASCVRCCDQLVHYAALPLHVHGHVAREINSVMSGGGLIIMNQ